MALDKTARQQMQPPVAPDYANQAAMIAAQASQVAGWFYHDGTTLWQYLGTTAGTIADYREAGGSTITVVAGTGISVDSTDPDNPIVSIGSATLAQIANGVTAHGWGNHASAGYLTSQAYPEMQARENNQLLFDNDYCTGIEAAARSGNITASFTGAKRGAVTVMRHNDASAFTYPTGATQIGATSYVPSVNNIITFMLVDKTTSSEKIYYTIMQ